MKIIFEDDTQIKELTNVRMGEVFIYKNTVYMKLGAYTDLNYNAIRLSDGTFEKIHQHCEVEIVKCELVINKWVKS